MQCTYFIMQAGGNMGGDRDQIGRPVVDGAFYVAAQRSPLDEDPGDHAAIVAGPFGSGEAADDARKALNSLTQPPDSFAALRQHPPRYVRPRCPECNSLATGEVQWVSGVAGIFIDEDGTFRDWSGDTDVDWNSQLGHFELLEEDPSRALLTCGLHEWESQVDR